jgi:hypothetical protein
MGKVWVVAFDGDAVLDLEEVKSKGDRKAVFNAVHKLQQLGPELPSPHIKSLKGERALRASAQTRRDRGSPDFRAGRRPLRDLGCRSG